MSKESKDRVAGILGQVGEQTNPLELKEGERENVQICFKLPRGWRDRMRKHFADRGTDLSTGLRQLIADYMTSKRLR